MRIMAEKLTENTVIGATSVSPERYRAFFRKMIDGFSPEVHCGDFEYWLSLNNGKTIKEAVASYRFSEPLKIIEERLTEERFSIITEPDKAFILAFDKEISEFGYDYGGHIGWGACWGRYMIIYSKVGIKSKQVAARIFIRDNSIVLRLFLNNVDKHTQYIENTPEHIKAVFTGAHGECSCSPRKENCRMRKSYAIGGKQVEKCSGVVFEFHQPDISKLHDYMGLFGEFYRRMAK